MLIFTELINIISLQLWKWMVVVSSNMTNRGSMYMYARNLRGFSMYWVYRVQKGHWVKNAFFDKYSRGNSLWPS